MDVRRGKDGQRMEKARKRANTHNTGARFGLQQLW
jgi:hypothetical protein